MREIKYRAFIKSLKVMADVLVVNFEDRTVLLKGYKRNTWANFDQVILLQYTGLKDINGVEVYEGDALEVDEEYMLNNGGMSYEIVEWDEYYAGYKPLLDDYIRPRYLKVIGNVHKNKELLQ